MMSSLNVYQRFVDMQVERSKMQLPNLIGAVLDYSEYSIRMDFNLSEKNNYLSKKSRKNELGKQFVAALVTLNRQQKIEYYCMVVSFMRDFSKGCFQPPKSKYSGMLNAIGYSRSFNIKRWKEKKLRLDMDKHLMFAEREQKIKSYDMRNYILRRSKNKEYFCFVLEAINRTPPEKSMTVHIGFTEESKFKEWFQAIKFSVELRQWEFYLNMFHNNGLSKSMSARGYTTDDMYFKTTSGVIEERKASEVDFMSSSVVVEPSKKLEMLQSVTHEVKIKREGFEEGEKTKVKSSEQREKNTELNQKLKEKNKLEDEIKVFESRKQIGKTIVDELIDGDIFEQPDVFQQKIEEEDQINQEGKKHLDLFHKLYPQYELQQLQEFANFQIMYDSPRLKIFQNTLLQKKLKMLIVFDKLSYNREQILSMLSKPETSHLYNDNIESAQLKTFIHSENSALMYQVNKAYNRLYRARDFVFIRHVFNQRQTVYMIDKSIENVNYPPFMTIVRGSLCNVFGIFDRKDNIELIADIEIQNEGLINPVQEINLNVKYLKGFSKMVQAEIAVNEYKFFNLDWDIAKNKANLIENEIRSRRKTINMLELDINNSKEEHSQNEGIEKRNFSKKQSQFHDSENAIKSDPTLQTPEKPLRPASIVESLEKSNGQSGHSGHSSKSLENFAEKSPSPEPIQLQSPKKNKDHKMQEIGEKNGEQMQQKSLSTLNVIRQLTEEGLVVTSQSYIKKKYRLQPLPQSKILLLGSPHGHPLWKNQWIHDDLEGGILFIHKKKIEDQKGVLKFILSKIAKNLVSGQSITNISLPVDIFSAESNLQRFLYSMCYGPLVLQRMEKQNMLTRFVNTVIFGVSNSVLYLSMEKPFNPILGETFQCWINGCPAYAEQISHHPPIAALIFKGRGYEVTAQLQSKVSLGLNSGTGTNDGIYRVKFTDGMEICFITSGGEVSGLTHGDRKFNLVGKAYFWITGTNFLMQLVFDPYKKGFFSIGKQEKPSDYIEGTIWEVRPEFMTKFLGGKRKQPQEKDRVREFGKISGIWNRYICYNGQEVFNFDKQYPIILQYETDPLPSDSNWREDIEYRRRNQITRAQTEKERLEVIQRKDRKWREKLGKKK